MVNVQVKQTKVLSGKMIVTNCLNTLHNLWPIVWLMSVDNVDNGEKTYKTVNYFDDCTII